MRGKAERVHMHVRHVQEHHIREGHRHGSAGSVLLRAQWPFGVMQQKPPSGPVQFVPLSPAHRRRGRRGSRRVSSSTTALKKRRSKCEGHATPTPKSTATATTTATPTAAPPPPPNTHALFASSTSRTAVGRITVRWVRCGVDKAVPVQEAGIFHQARPWAGARGGAWAQPQHALCCHQPCLSVTLRPPCNAPTGGGSQSEGGGGLHHQTETLQNCSCPCRTSVV